MMDIGYNDPITTFDAPSPFDMLESHEAPDNCCEESRSEWLSRFFGEEPNLPLETLEEASRLPGISRSNSELLPYSRQSSETLDVLPPEQLCFLGFTDSQCDSDGGFDMCETWFQEEGQPMENKQQQGFSESSATVLMKKTQRGLHVASNPQIQQTARDGQVT